MVPFELVLNCVKEVGFELKEISANTGGATAFSEFLRCEWPYIPLAMTWKLVIWICPPLRGKAVRFSIVSNPPELKRIGWTE